MSAQCPSCQASLVPGAIYCHLCGRRLLPMRFVPRLAKGLLIGGAGLCLAAWLAIFVEVESVVGTGPAILLVGVILSLVSGRLRFWPGLIIGIGHAAICILFTALVNLLEWSPAEAYLPFVSMGAVYCAITVPLSIHAFRRVPAAYDPTRCARCGYLLIGLTEPRCPECGTAFDPVNLAPVQS